MTRVGENVEKRNPCALLVGTQIGAVTVESRMEFPQKVNIELPYDPVIPFMGIHPPPKSRILI